VKIQFQILRPWLPEILGAIKKDIKSDYLPGSHAFYRTHFGSRPQNRLTTEEINNALSQALLDGDEDLAEWVINRWVFKHGEIYTHFADRLAGVNPDFDSIQTLSPEQSEQILAGAKEAFGAKPVFFFAALNGVVFPEAIFERLRNDAENEQTEKLAEEKTAGQQQELTKIIERQQRELARYEQKLAGVLKRYETDITSLKKQIRSLQKK